MTLIQIRWLFIVICALNFARASLPDRNSGDVSGIREVCLLVYQSLESLQKKRGKVATEAAAATVRVTVVLIMMIMFFWFCFF